MKKALLGPCLVLLCFFVNGQNVFESVQSGNWDDASTWKSGAASGGIEGIDYPSASDSVYVLHDIEIVTANSGSDFVFSGYLNIAAGDTLRCSVGNSSNGFLLNGNGVMHLYGIFYTAVAGEQPSTASPTAKEFTVDGNSQFVAFTGASMFVSDDWEIQGNASVYVEDNVCIRVDDDVNFAGTGWTMCGDGDISIGGDGVNSTVNFNSSATDAQICTGTSILRNTSGTDCSSGTTLSTGTGATNAPPTAVDDTAATDINTAVNISVLTLGTDDSDISLDTLQITSAGANGGVNDNTTTQGGTLSIDDNGTPLDFTDDFITYTPAAGFTGTDTFQYIITDEDNLTDTANVIVEVIDCGNSWVELIGVGANGATTAQLTFSDTTTIDSIVCELVFKNGLPGTVTYTSSAGQVVNGVNELAINNDGDDGVSRATLNSASTIDVSHANSADVRSFLAYIYRSGTSTAITSRHNRTAVYLFQDTYSFSQDIPAGNGPRNIRIQMPISELNNDSRSALLEVQAGPVYGSLETFTEDLGNSLKIFTLVLEDVPGSVTTLDVTITSKTAGAGDSFITAGIDFGVQCTGSAPETTNDFASTTQNNGIIIDILANDLPGDGGFDTTSITNTGLLDPQNGTVTFNASGQAVYIPDASFTGVDYFEYKVCDGRELCDIALVTVNVSCSGGQFTDLASTVGLDLGGGKDGGLTWADLNNDDLIDVIVNTTDGTNDTRIYFADNSSGVLTFTDVTATNAAGMTNTIDRSVVTADLNNDGYTDFVRNDYNGNGIEVWFNRGPGSSPAYSFGDASQNVNFSQNTFNTSGTVFNTEGVVVFDWNQDGWIDIIVENDGGGIEVLQNDRDGTFSEIAHATTGFSTGSGGSGNGDYATAIDFNNDGYVDYMARRTSEVDLYQFDSGSGSFSSVASPNLQTSNGEKGAITFCDLDQDGDFDIIWAHQSNDNQTSIYTQNSDGSFSLAINLVNDGGVEECDCADVDNDGDNDVFLGDDGGTSYLYKNNTTKGGSLSFSLDNDCIDVNGDAEGAEFVDYDQDGDMDLYVNVNGGANQLWSNGQDDNNYLKVEPRINLGGGKWRSAIGANVVLIANCADTCMIMDVSGGRGHGSQKPAILHFGLANGPDINYKIVTFFPDSGGTIDTVIQTVTPSNLSGQKLIVYQTDTDYDICEDADQDGINNAVDIDDDNDGILDVDEGCPIYTGSITSQSGIGNSTNVTGSPDGSFAEWHTNGDIMVIDFGTTYAAGTRYEIIWRERTGQSGTASMIIEESTDNSSYTTHTSAPTTNSTTAVGNIVTAQNSFRYLRISKDDPPSTTDFEIDAIGIQSCTDSDNDGIIDIYDLDSDNDGIPDIVEAGGEDTDGNGIVDGTFTDGDGDGWSNVFDSNNGGTALNDPDTDGDGQRDRVDLDSDNDGIQDVIEAGGTDHDGNGYIDGNDSDGDGLSDIVDTDAGGTALSIPNSDGVGAADYLDIDSDDDGIPDIIEAGGVDSNNDGVVDTATDTDGDGWANTFDKGQFRNRASGL